jgi:putative oxidoreductase
MIRSFGFLLLRLSIGVMLIHHGYEKLDSIENFADAFVRPLHIPFPITMSYLAAFSEIFGSWLVIFGLGTRIGALAIMGTVSFGIYHAIVTSGFNIYLLELLVLYWGGTACVVLNGGGNFSLDHLIKRRLTTTTE